VTQGRSMRALDIMMRHNTIRRNNFLTLAGGAQQAMRLAKLINHAVYKDPARIEDLLNIAAGNAAVFARLAGVVPLFSQHPIGVPPVPSNLTPPTTMPGAQQFGAANMSHFLDEHTYEYYDFAETGNRQSFWPAGTTAQDVATSLEDTINDLRGKRIIVAPNTPVSVHLSSGIDVRFGVKGSGSIKKIGQFFPLSGRGVETFDRAALRAIKRILVP